MSLQRRTKLIPRRSRNRLHLRSQCFEGGDALFDWRVRREPLLNAAHAAKRIDDTQMRGLRRHRAIGNSRGADFQLLQAVNQTVGRAGEMRGKGVGFKFARARNGALNHYRGDWPDNGQSEDRQQIVAVARIAADAKHRAKTCDLHQQHQRARKRGDDGHRQGVAPRDVTQLVRDNALDFALVE